MSHNYVWGLQVNAKRTRGAAALNVIAEESCEENIDKKAMKGKKPRTAG